MATLTILFIGFAVMLGAWFWWVVPKSRYRWAGIVTFALILAGTYATATELLSRTKPISLEWMARNTQSAEVLAYAWEEGKAIYVWLLLPGISEPRAYAIPWSIQTMQQLQQGREGGGEEGFMLMLPFQWSWEDRESPFHPVPQPKMPDKGGQPVPETYDMPEQGI